MIVVKSSTPELGGSAAISSYEATPSRQHSANLRPKITRLRTRKALKRLQLQKIPAPDLRTSLQPIPSAEFSNGTPLKILIAPSGFKESLGPELVADAIEAGVYKVLDEDNVITQKLPLHDGGEGFARALVAAQGGEIVEETIIGPIGLPIDSHLGFLGENRNIAVLDMAAAAGLRLVPKNARDPTVTTTYGVGQLIAKALNAGSSKIIIGCGDSGTSDGGAGMLQALGVRLLDAEGKELQKAGGGQSLSRLDRICWCNVHPRLRMNASKSCDLFLKTGFLIIFQRKSL